MHSPLETVFMLVRRIREEREHMRLKALFLASSGASAAAFEAFNDLTREVFFMDELEERRKQRDPQELLNRWLGVGAVGVKT